MAAVWTVVLAALVGVSASAGPDPTLPSPPPRQAIRSLAATTNAAAFRAQDAKPVESPVKGKGMWIYELPKVAGGKPKAVAWLARQGKLTHIYVRVGSSKVGLKTLDEAASVLPYAHELGIKVIAWYFPYFNNIPADVRRSKDAIGYQYQGHRFDGFAADIETAPGSALSAATVGEYSSGLRMAAPNAYLIAVPPRPTETTIKRFPYDAMMPYYDAVAPMVYWGRFDPQDTVESSIRYLARWGKPVSPIGQAYDMGTEGGPVGNPRAQDTWAFMRTAKQRGAIGVSFWSWQHASSPEWRAIRLFGWER